MNEQKATSIESVVAPSAGRRSDVGDCSSPEHPPPISSGDTPDVQDSTHGEHLTPQQQQQPIETIALTTPSTEDATLGAAPIQKEGVTASNASEAAALDVKDASTNVEQSPTPAIDAGAEVHHQQQTGASEGRIAVPLSSAATDGGVLDASTSNPQQVKVGESSDEGAVGSSPSAPPSSQVAGEGTKPSSGGSQSGSGRGDEAGVGGSGGASVVLDDYIQSPEVQSAIVERSPGGRYVRFSEKLGSGASKDVYRAYDTQEGIEVAWNVVNLSGVPKTERNRIVNEVRLLERLHHHNIISFHGSWVNRERQEVNFVTEILSSGTLKSFINKVQVIRWKIAKRWAVQILQGLQYLHSQDPPVIHRDLKCDNIFINGTSGDLRIGDLGLSTVHRNGRVLSVLGTPEFMAPDMYEEQSYDEKVDIYAFGMCMLEIFTKEIPYRECMNPAQIYKKVSSGEPPEVLSRLQSRNAREFVMLCLGYKDENGRYVRPSATELLRHPFLEKRASDDDEVFVDPPLYERVIPEGSESQTSPIGTPMSKSKGKSINEASNASAVDRGASGTEVQHDPSFQTGSPIPSHAARSRTSSLSDNDGDRFEEMPQSETQIRKVKVLMGRGRELEEEEDTPAATLDTVDIPRISAEVPTEVPAPNAQPATVAASALPVGEQQVQIPQQIPVVPDALQHYLVAAAVIENESPNSRPYPDDVLKLVVTLPVEGQTQNVQFDFHLVEDDPIKVAKEMVQELGIPQGAVLEISETISGLACAARMKVEKFNSRQQHLLHQMPPTVIQPPAVLPPVNAAHMQRTGHEYHPNMPGFQAIPQQAIYLHHGNVPMANRVDSDAPAQNMHVHLPHHPPQTPAIGQHVPGLSNVPPPLPPPTQLPTDTNSQGVPVPVHAASATHPTEHAIQPPMQHLQQQQHVHPGVAVQQQFDQPNSSQHVANPSSFQQESQSVSGSSGVFQGLNAMAGSSSQSGVSPGMMVHAPYPQGVAMATNALPQHAQVPGPQSEISQASFSQHAFPLHTYGSGAPEDANRVSHPGIIQQGTVQAQGPMPHRDSYPASQPLRTAAPAIPQGEVVPPQVANSGTGNPSATPISSIDAVAGMYNAVHSNHQMATGQEAPNIMQSSDRSVQAQLSDPSLPPYQPGPPEILATSSSASHARHPTSPESIPFPASLSQRANTTGTSSTLGSDDSEPRRRPQSFSSSGQSPPLVGEASEMDPGMEEELRKLEEEFERNMQRAKKVFDNRMDNLQRSQIEREAQHQKTLEKHMKERDEFEKRLALEQEQQLRRMEQLQREWEKKREALAQHKRALLQQGSTIPPNGSQSSPPISVDGSAGGPTLSGAPGDAHRRQVSGNLSSQTLTTATLDQIHAHQQYMLNGAQEQR